MNRGCDLDSLFAKDDDIESAMRVLDKLGIQLKYVNGTFVSAREVLNEVYEVFSNLDSRAAIEAADALVSFDMGSKTGEDETGEDETGQNALDTFLNQFLIKDGRCEV